MEGRTLPQIDWKIDLGHFITILIVLLALAVSWGNLGGRIDSQATLMMELKSQAQAQSRDITTILQEQGRVKGVLEEHDRTQLIR